MNEKFTIFWFSLALICQASAQAPANYSFRHLTHMEGLIGDRVFKINQDRRGFIWIGTENGLQRYDGYRFVNYQAGLNSGNQSDISIGLIDIAGPNDLLLGRGKDLDLLTNRLADYGKERLLQLLGSGTETFPMTDSTGWVTSGRYAYRFSPSGIFVNFCTTDIPGNQIWIAGDSGLVLIDKKTKKVYSQKFNPIHHPLLQPSYFSKTNGILMDSQGDLWLPTWSERFYKYHSRTGKISTYSLESIKKQNHIGTPNAPLQVNDIFEDNHRQVWIATSNAGLLLYHPATDDFSSIRYRREDSRGILYNYEIFCIFQDKDENIWLGTDRGINIFNPYQHPFTIIRNEENTENTLPKREIDGMIQTRRGEILVGTWGGGISVYSKDWEFIRRIVFPGAYELNMIWCFAEADDGKIWIGCQHGYIHIYDPDSGLLSTIHPEAMQQSTIRCVTRDPEGNLLFGLHNGRIIQWNKSRQAFDPFNEASTNPGSGSFAPVHTIFLDHHGACWVSTEKGLKLFDREKRTYTGSYLTGDNKPNAFEGIAESNDSLLMVGLVNGGMTLFCKTDRTFRYPRLLDKLASSTVHAVQKDAEGNIWFTTDYDLYKLNVQQNSFARYSTEQQEVNSRFESTCFYPLRSGRWATANSTEILCFNPDSLDRQTDTVAPAVITGLRLFDQPLFIDSFLLKNKPLKLGYRENFLTFEFATLNFSNIRQTRYVYQLNGIDKDWVNADNTGEANYTNLAPGNYVFYVRQDNGRTSLKSAAFAFTISPPFWQTWWFRAAMSFLLIGVIIYGFQRRIRNIRVEAELKLRITETEMMALRAQMNPHFIFNCLNAIDSLIQTHQKDKATTYLARFARLLRSILESTRNNTVSFQKDLESLKLYLQMEQFRCSDRFTYRIDVEEELLFGDFQVPPMIIQPFIENAIYHGLLNKEEGERSLQIDIRQKEDDIVYFITDNGVGRQRSAAIKALNRPDHISYGIDITRRRINLYNRNEADDYLVFADLVDEDGPAGTRVEVRIVNSKFHAHAKNRFGRR